MKKTNKKFGLLITLCTLFCMSMYANSNEGIWKIHSVFNQNRVRVVDAVAKVYYVADKYLFSYDKNTNETQNLTSDNVLSDLWVKNIYYNPIKKFLVVAYQNGNIDIITNDGVKVNIPDYKNLNALGTKGINDITFAAGRIYVATMLGYYVIDDLSFKIIESNYLGSKVQSVAELSTKILISDGAKLYYTNKGSKITSIRGMTATAITGAPTMTPINGDTCFVSTTALFRVYFDAAGIFKYVNISGSKILDLLPSNNGFIGVGGGTIATASLCQFYDKSGTKTKVITYPKTFTGALLSSMEEDGSLWALGDKGLQKVSIGDAGIVTELTQKILPNTLSASAPYNLVYNGPLNKLYAMNTGTNFFFSAYGQIGNMSAYDGKKWTDIAPESANTIGNLKNSKINDPYYPVFDPEDPETYYVGTWYEGAYKIKGSTVLAKYDWTNSPLTWASNKFYCNVSGLQFDKNYNLWLIQTHTSGDGDVPHISVLTRDKQNMETLTASDWLTPKIPGLTTTKRMRFLITSQDIKIFSNGDYKGPIFIFDDKGNPASTNIISKKYNNFLDDKGKMVEWQYVMDLAEDKTGLVWVGISSGLMCFDPTKALSDNFTITHKKLKNNQGKYVLDNVWVSCIAVDEYNRKWVGSADDGVYLLNADGDEVLAHFTQSNSELADNKVISLAWNSLNKSIFIGINGALYEYFPESSLFSSDFSDVMVSPKYIKPDFRDVVRISGLPAGTIVVIKDNSGKTIRTLQSKGADAVWDCINDSGERVETGIYSISALSADEIVTKDNLAKIYFIK